MQDHSAPPLRRIYLYLSGACNLACRHCWIDPAPAASISADGYLPLEVLQRIILDAIELGLKSVKLTGGEPLLHPQAMKLVQWLQARGLAVVMETNGTLVDAAVAGVLRDVGAEVAVSLDGPTADVHEALRGAAGSFTAALRGIHALRAAGVRFQIVTCLYRANRGEIPRMVGLARECGARSIKINPIVGVSRAGQMRAQHELLSVAEVLQTCGQMRAAAKDSGIRIEFDIPPAFEPIASLRAMPLRTCGILNILGVLHDGHASMCGIGRLAPELDMGDLTTLDIREVWREHPLLRRLRDNVPQKLGGICGRCMLKRYCFGKCLAHDYLESREMFGGHGFCREAYEAGLFPTARLVTPACCRKEAGP